MWSGGVSNPGPLTYESGALPTALHCPAGKSVLCQEDGPFAYLRSVVALSKQNMAFR